MPYFSRRPAELERLKVRGLEFQFYRWPGTDPKPILLLHGWGDSGETFQFIVDHLSSERTLLAFDARGFGRSEWPADGYWFPDYLADLDAIVDQLSPQLPIDLVGHSMGGNVVMLYAGVRPQRVRRVVSLEGFGTSRTTPDQTPARYREWLDQTRSGESFAKYDSFEHFVRILARRNPRTCLDRLDFVARSWAQQNPDGLIELRADPRHKHVNPILYQREQALACWREISAPLLFVSGDQSDFAKRVAAESGEQALLAAVKGVTLARVEQAGHMMHHECPEAVAELLERFLRSS